MGRDAGSLEVSGPRAYRFGVEEQAVVRVIEPPAAASGQDRAPRGPAEPRSAAETPGADVATGER